jgi:type IV pilus assembly protein PilX
MIDFATTPLPFKSQRGAALIIAMILLLIMSLLAATSLRGTLMQERMSSNTYDHDLAFQSAEAGLRMGERLAENWATGGGSDLQGCQNPNTRGFYRSTNPVACPQDLWEIAEPGATGSFWYDTEKDGSSSGSDAIVFGEEKLSLAPYYIVELIAENAPCQINDPDNMSTQCKRFRVTASSRAGEGRARVVLQSIYATE